MITQALRALVSSATAHAERFNDGEDRTVAAALLTTSGEHVLGLNSYHFLGGPCGEITALANHAATRPSDSVVAAVAVYGPTGQVIAPCGKRRQVLHDLDPTIQCVVRSSKGLEAISVADLLPHAYGWRESPPSLRSGAVISLTSRRKETVSGRLPSSTKPSTRTTPAWAMRTCQTW